MKSLIKKRKYTIIILFFVLLFAIIFYLRKDSSNIIIFARIAPVQHGELTSSVTAIGKVKPSKEVSLTVQIDGVIENVLVEEGDNVSEEEEVMHLIDSTGKVVIRSPLSGTVLLRSKNAEKGVAVTPGQPLLTIGDISKLQVEAEINEIEAKDLKNGQQVRITSDAYAGQKYSGIVEKVAPMVHEFDGVAKLPVLIKFSSFSPFKPGNRVDIEIITARRKNVYFVPLEAIGSHNGYKMIYILNDNKASEQKVKTGISNINYIEILPENTISNDSKVILSDNKNIKDGDIVKTY